MQYRFRYTKLFKSSGWSADITQLFNNLFIQRLILEVVSPRVFMCLSTARFCSYSGLNLANIGYFRPKLPIKESLESKE